MDQYNQKRVLKDSGLKYIGAIPSQWAIKRVKHGFFRRSAEAHIENPTVLSLARSGVKVRDLSQNEGQIAESYYNYNPVEPGDLLLNPMDLYSGANCSISKVSGVISPAYVNLRNKSGFDSSYYDYFFKIQYWSMALFSYGKGVSFDNRWTLSAADLLNYYIPYPPITEQRCIVDFLDARCTRIDSILEKTRTSIEEYKKLKQAIITQAVTQGVRGERPMKESGFQYIGKVPSDWVVTKLRNIGIPQNGISKGGEFFGTGYPFVSYSDVYKNILLPQTVDGLIVSTEEEQERYSVKAGDIFFTRTSETVEEVGLSSVCEQDIPKATFAGFLIRVRPFDGTLQTGFSKYYFRSTHHRAFFSKEMNLITRASLGQSLLKRMSVLIPPIDEQKEIADYLDQKCTAIDNLITKKEQTLLELENYKKSMIYEYVTGKKEGPSNELEAIVVDPILLKALLYLKTYELLGKNCRGRVQIQKMLYLIESMNDLNLDSQYARQKYGPMDADLDAVEAFMEEKCWLKTIQGSPTAYQKMDHYQEYHTEFSKYLASYEVEIERIVRFFENKNTSEAERFATLVAVWNDFILDGNANPSDEELIHEVITNWHPHKANFKYTTWQDTVSKMRAHGIIPHGYGRHTILR